MSVARSSRIVRTGFFVAATALGIFGLTGGSLAEPTTQSSFSWTVTAAPQGADPDYSKYTKSYTIPYAPFGKNKVMPDFTKPLGGLNVRASINGGPVRTFQVDTGSWGIVVGDTDVPNIDPNAPAGSIVYSSSGNGFYGKWTDTTVAFPDSKDADGNVATAMVPVLAADTFKHTPGAVNDSKAGYKESPHPHPYMFGIGSGRGPEVTQFRNPWVNLKEMRDGSMRRGYILTPKGITLGLTAENTKGFVYEKLAEHTGKPTTWPAQEPISHDWDASTGYVVVDGKKMETSWMLLDTGLTNMMLEFPEINGQAAVADGTPIDVYLLGGKLKYSFKVGDKSDLETPLKVSWTHHDAPPMINTGLRALAHFDYLYDADGGYSGLRPRAK